ncbi:uncharacterized protein L201_001282 [Kwoniella dendrophila CBS 6074]|uniref:Protein CPL1-like domain-containing protein n=1 Tax=Kwoniella dendrophila CBS 6074 TaxID=1295534 RepID=A0AAX4JMZ0_9TREE
MFFSKVLIVSLLSLSTSVLSMPTPTLSDEEGLAKRYYQDHQRYHRSTGSNAHPSASVSAVPSAGGQRKVKKPIPTAASNSTGPLPLGALEDLARCPAQQMACPVSPMTDVELAQSNADTPYECVLSQEDLYSCGGCTTLGTGLDCTAIPGVLSVSCSIGVCDVYSCKPGFTVTSDGQGCVEVISQNATIPSTEPSNSANITGIDTSPLPTANSTEEITASVTATGIVETVSASIETGAVSATASEAPSSAGASEAAPTSSSAEVAPTAAASEAAPAPSVSVA